MVKCNEKIALELILIYTDVLYICLCVRAIEVWEDIKLWSNSGMKTDWGGDKCEGNNRCLFPDPHKTQKYTVRAEHRIVEF